MTIKFETILLLLLFLLFMPLIGAKKVLETNSSENITSESVEMSLLEVPEVIRTTVLSDAVFSSAYDNTFIQNSKHIIQNPRGISKYTGNSIFEYPLLFSKGRNDMTPKLSLFYSHQSIKSNQEYLSNGWALTSDYIQRNINNTRSNVSDDYFELSFNGNFYKLFYNDTENGYHTEIESYLHISKENTSNNNEYGDYWIVKDKSGTIYRFGYNNESENIASEEYFIYRWYLDLIQDVYGNIIFYNYLEDPFTSDSGSTYLDSIEYNNNKTKKIEFIYEDQERLNKRYIFSNGNKITYSRRLNKIRMIVQNITINEYILQYSDLTYDSRDFLKSISFSSNDIILKTNFTYKEGQKQWYRDQDYSAPYYFNYYRNGNIATDINGDGLSDFLVSKEVGSDKYAYINTGSGWNYNSSWNSPFWFDEMLGNYIASDINGDGLVDFLISTETGSEKKVYINTGTGWILDSSWRIPLYFDGLHEDAFVLTDINGDGLPDFIISNDMGSMDHKKIYINNGQGWVSDSTWDNLPFYINNYVGTFLVTDVNGDGLADFLISTETGSEKKVYINTGTGWILDSGWRIPLYFDGLHGDAFVLTDVSGDGLVDFVISDDMGAFSYEGVSINTGLTWVSDSNWETPFYFDEQIGNYVLTDVSGDGLTDFVISYRNGDNIDEYFYINSYSKDGLLETVKTNFGGEVIFDYNKSTSFKNNGDDGISDLAFNVWVVSNITKNDGLGNLFSIQYNYSDGVYDYDDKEFRGFNFVEEINKGRIERSWFHQDDAKKGKEYRTDILDEGNLIKKILKNWNSSGDKYFNVKLYEESVILFYENNSVTLNVSYDYDSYGNVLLRHNKGNVDNLHDDTYEYFSYVYNITSWITNKVKSYSIIDYNNTLLNQINYSYDNLTYGFPPLRGSLTKEVYWNNDRENLVMNKEYDSYGNLIAEEDPLGNTIRYIYGLRDLTNTFIDRIINKKGFAVDYNYDLGIGKPLWIRDSDGIYSNYTYNGMGLLIKEILYGDSFESPTKEYEYNFDGITPEQVLIKYKSNDNVTYNEYQFYDGFGRVIQLKKDAEYNKQIVENVFYDSRSRIIERSNPYFIYYEQGYSLPRENESKYDFTYDALDRLTLQVNADGTNKTTIYDLLNISYYDEKNNKIKHSFDVFGNILNIYEYNNNEIYLAKYNYDSLQNLVSIIDNENNVFNFSYDSLSRKILEIDPNLGVLQYEYDLNGNLISENRSYGGLISDGEFIRGYNNLGELINVSYTNGTLIERYLYDHNGIRIKTYNALRNEIIYTPFKEFMQIRNESGVFNYTYIYEEDILVAKINPDGSKYFYHADNLGSTSLITDEFRNIIENINYYPFGLPMSETNERKLYENKEYSSDIDEYNYNFRNYNPELRIFTKADSIIPDVYDPQQLNRYSFERNNPYKYRDEDGHAIGVVGALAIGAGVGSIIGGGATAYSTYYNEGQINWAKVGKSAGIGAVAGGASVGLIALATTTSVGYGSGLIYTGLSGGKSVGLGLGLFGIGATESVATQTIVEGKSLNEVSVSEVMISGGTNTLFSLAPLGQSGRFVSKGFGTNTMRDAVKILSKSTAEATVEQSVSYLYNNKISKKQENQGLDFFSIYGGGQ